MGHQGGSNTGQLVAATFYAGTGQWVIRKLEIVEGILEGVGSSIAIPEALIQGATYTNLVYFLSKLVCGENSPNEVVKRVRVPWNNKLVQIDQGQILVAIHGSVEAVVEGREESFGADLLLAAHPKVPRQDANSGPLVTRRLEDSGRGIVGRLRRRQWLQIESRQGAGHHALLVALQHAGGVGTQSVVVEREVGDAEQSVELQVLHQIQCLVVVEVERLHTNGNAIRNILATGNRPGRLWVTRVPGGKVRVLVGVAQREKVARRSPQPGDHTDVLGHG